MISNGKLDEIMDILAFEEEKLRIPEKRYAWMVREQFGDDFTGKVNLSTAPYRTKRQVYNELGLTYKGRVLGRSILGRSILGRSSGQGHSIPFRLPHEDAEL